MESTILKWVNIAQEDLYCFENPQHTFEMVKGLSPFLHIEEIEDKGVVAYTIYPDFRGRLALSEVFMYVKPEYRGGLIFRDIVRRMEKAAKKNACKIINIGSNIGYKDDKILRLLSLMGYKTDTVSKEL